MHFVDRDRRVELVRFFPRFALLHLWRQPANQRSRFRTHLRFEGVRIGLDAQRAASVDHLEFIQLAVMRAGDKQLPNARFPAQSHRVTTAVPVVKLPHHGNALSVRRPNGKACPGDAVHSIRMRTQLFIRAQMGSFGQQPCVHLLEQRAKAIGIVNKVLLAMPDDGQLIAKRIFTARQNAAKEAT